MRRSLVLGLAACVGLAVCSPAEARRIEDWPYDKLMKESDLVVFATPVKTEAGAGRPAGKRDRRAPVISCWIDQPLEM